MIIEGFEIENWSCIKRVVADNLPPTGVIVIHGPNGTGKSSILEALRACMMDNKSTSKALGRGFPKNSSDKPRVSVTFRSQGTTYKISKQFNSKESRLESRSPSGQWKLETDDPSEAHDRTRQLAGGSDSSLGLHQLLWLTQAEFHLPEPKKFDADIQSRLRAVLGVLQTELDDRFLGRVKNEWSQWFNARSKPGEKPKLKKDCLLDKKQAELARRRTELGEIDREFQALETRMEKADGLQVLSKDLSRQVAEKVAARDLLREEYEKSVHRLTAHEFAVKQLAMAEKSHEERCDQRGRRTALDERVREAERSAEVIDGEVERAGQQLQSALERLEAERCEFQALSEKGRGQRDQLDKTNKVQHWLDLEEQTNAKSEGLRRAESVSGEIEAIKKQGRERPAPDDALMKTLGENRTEAARLRAELDAAAILLSLVPDPGVAPPTLMIDGTSVGEAESASEGVTITRPVRRRAEIRVPGWGRIELTRGSDARSLDQIEKSLNDLDAKYAAALAPFGIPAGSTTALDLLRERAAEKRLRDVELKGKEAELARLAPRGLESLREEVAELASRLKASEPDDEDARSSRTSAQLTQQMSQLKEDIESTNDEIAALEAAIVGLEREIDGDRLRPTGGKAGVTRGERRIEGRGLRQKEADARDRRATIRTQAADLREQLEHFPAVEQVEAEIRESALVLEAARAELEAAMLNESETTIRGRLDAIEEGVKAIEKQLSSTDKALHEIKGAMSQTEGLHPRRAAAAARVEELERLIDRETMESESYDRLYALFEECREKQLGYLMGPIHDRLLRWMKLLRIGDYQSIRFNDQFLPDTLVSGVTELTLGEESTGTIEQIALMVRLALGSTLSSAEEPVVAMLDDPLTHSDVVRLDRMRAVLKDASAGSPGLTPPAGPLQVILFTCHPEWFVFDGATVVDLTSPDVLSKRC